MNEKQADKIIKLLESINSKLDDIYNATGSSEEWLIEIKENLKGISQDK